MAEVLSGERQEVRDGEMVIERPDGSRVTVIVNIRPLKNQRGEVRGAINCFYDITERKKADERQHFLMSELAHRDKNLLAVIQSIASYSLTGTRPLAEERDALMHRIQALARSQSVLVTGGFEGRPWRRSSGSSSRALRPRRCGRSRDHAEPKDRADLQPHRPRARDQCHEVRRAVGAARPCRDPLVDRWRRRLGALQVPVAGTRRTAGGRSDPPGLRQHIARQAAAADFLDAPKIEFFAEGLIWNRDRCGAFGHGRVERRAACGRFLSELDEAPATIGNPGVSSRHRNAPVSSMREAYVRRTTCSGGRRRVPGGTEDIDFLESIGCEVVGPAARQGTPSILPDRSRATRSARHQPCRRDGLARSPNPEAQACAVCVPRLLPIERSSRSRCEAPYS